MAKIKTKKGSKRSKHKLMIKKLDNLWSKVVRERDNYTCQHCGRHHKQVQAAHIFSRNNKSTRWDPDNGVTLCYYCHIQWAHREPVEITKWVINRLGEKKFNELERKANEIVRNIDYEAIEEKLKKLLEKYKRRNE